VILFQNGEEREIVPQDEVEIEDDGEDCGVICDQCGAEYDHMLLEGVVDKTGRESRFDFETGNWKEVVQA